MGVLFVFTTEFLFSLSAPRDFGGTLTKITLYLYIYLDYRNNFNRFLLHSKIRIVE